MPENASDPNLPSGAARGTGIRKVPFILLFLFFTLGTLSAETLTINSAFNMAKQNSQSYLLSLEQYQNYVNEENKVDPFIPSLSVSGSLSTGGGFLPSSYFSGLGYSVSASASLALDPTVYTDRKTRDANNQSQLLSLMSTEDTLYTNVATAYLNVLLYREAVEVSASSLEIARAQYESVLASYNAGETSELELMQAANALQSEEYTHEQNQSSLSSAERSFKVLTGIDIDAYELIAIDDIGYLSLPSSDEIFSRYKDNSTAIQSAKNNVTVADLSLKTTRNSAFIPTVSISAAYTNTGTNIGSYNTTTSNRYSDSLTATVGVSIPIDGYLPGSSSHTSVIKAENNAEYARSSLEIAYEDLESSIDDVTASINLMQKQIAMLEEQVETLSYKVELSKRAYDNGLMSLTDLQDAYDSLEDGEYSLLSAKVSYISYVNTLATLIGMDGEEIYSIF